MTIPDPMSGNSPLAVWLNQLRRVVLGNIPLESADFRYEFTNHGHFARKKFQTTGTSQPAPASSLSAYVIVGLTGGDSVLAQKLTNFRLVGGQPSANPDGNTVLIAKPPPLRMSIASENFDGVVVTYSQAPAIPNPPDGYNDNNRVATASGQNESQVVFPRYRTWLGVGQTQLLGAMAPAVIFAAQTDNGSVTFNGSAPIKLVEISPSRVWCKRFST